MQKRLLRHSFSLLHVDRVSLGMRWNYQNVISPYFRIYYIDGGEGIVSTADEIVKLERGYLYIIPSFTLCHLKCDSFLSQYFVHFFEESADGLSLFENNRRVMKVQALDIDHSQFDRLLRLNPGRGINRSDNPRVYEKTNYYADYQQLNNTISIASFVETQGIILQLISRFLGSNSFESKRADPIPSRIIEVISYIQLNLRQDLTVSSLAKRASLHQDYFSRLFHRFTGERPLAYIHMKRIERAQYLMATTNLQYIEIAEETGFQNVPHFSKIFKKVTSLTPGEYRKRNEAVNQ